MFGSQNKKDGLILSLYKAKQTVFRLRDVALIVGETNLLSLSKKLNYQVRNGNLLNIRRGIYVKQNYSPEELICLLYTPSYISLDYVLQKSGVVFQYDSQLTAVSYLSREIEIDQQSYRYRKLKGSILVNPAGVVRQDYNINIALPERAFLDMLYLEKSYPFDNIDVLKKEKIFELLPLYESKTLTRHVNQLLKRDGHQ